MKKSGAPATEAGGKIESTKVGAPFVFALALVIGAIVGMVFSFSLFSGMIVNQAEKIGAQRDNIDILEKENLRFQEELQAPEKKPAEAECKPNQGGSSSRGKSNPRNPNPAGRAEAKGTAFPEYSGNSSALASAAANAATRQPNAAQKSSACNIGAGSPDKSIIRCLDEFKQK